MFRNIIILILNYFSIKYINSQLYSIIENLNISISEDIYVLLSNKNDFNKKISFKYLEQFFKNNEEEYIESNISNIIYPYYIQNNEIGYMNNNNDIYKIYFNGKEKEINYNIKNNYGENAYPSMIINSTYELRNNENNNDNNNDNNNENFIYIINNVGNTNGLSINSIFSSDVNSYSKIVNYKRMVFGLNSNDNFIYIIKNYTNKTDKIFNKNKHCFYGSIKNFFISNEYLISVLNDNETICLSKLIFYDSIYNPSTANFEIEFSINFTVYENNNILDVKIKNKFLYISIENEKVIRRYFIQSTGDKKLISNINFTYEFLIDDLTQFEIFSYTLYALEYDTSLIIFNLSDGNVINRISLKGMIAIDKFKNVFNNFNFLGIFLNNSKTDEFFIELFINNETYPTINKILCYKFMDVHYNFTNNYYITIDNYFTYFLDKNNNNIIAIRRGLINSIDFISFIFPIENINLINKDSIIVAYQNESSFLSNFGVYDKMNKTFILFNRIKYYNNSFNYSLNLKKGFYTILLNHISEICPGYNNSNYLCNIISFYNFRFVGNSHKKISILCVVLIIVFLIVIFTLIGFDVYLDKIKKVDNGLRIKTNVNKNDKKLLYINNNEYNNKNNKNIETKEFLKKKKKKRNKIIREIIEKVSENDELISKNSSNHEDIKSNDSLRSYNTNNNLKMDSNLLNGQKVYKINVSKNSQSDFHNSLSKKEDFSHNFLNNEMKSFNIEEINKK